LHHDFRCAETLFFDYRRQHNLTIKVMRIFNTYGPRMHENDGRVVSNFIVQALKRQPITIYGSGQQSRAFCYVDDLIDGAIRLMKTDVGVTGPINVGNPGQFTMIELAQMITKLKIRRRKSNISLFPRMIRSSGSRTSRRPELRSDGSRRSPSKKD
jgi:nucleoside-diphosphate-sugar epimerase